MARPLRFALAAAGAALVVGLVPLAAGALLARPETVCIDDWAVPRTAPSRDQDEQMQRDGATRVATGFPADAAVPCRLSVEVTHRWPSPVAWIAVLLASATAGAAAWWLAGGTRTRTAPAAGAAATGTPPSPPPSPVGPVTLTPFGEDGGYVDLPHGVVVWATQATGPAPTGGRDRAGGPRLRPGEPVHIRPAPSRGGGWVVGRDTFTPGGSER
jgi:hypothetical protein